MNLLLFYHTTMLLLHRHFIEFSSTGNNSAIVIKDSVDLDSLAADSRQACENAASNIAVIIRQKQSLMSDPDSYAPLCLPTCFVYSMFQASLIHLAIVIKNRDSLRRLRLLQKSIALMKQHEQLASARRAHHILLMLVAINGININNLLENETPKEEEQLSPTSPLPKYPRDNNTSIIQGCEDTIPKSSWYQRMMNTSIVGGITPDLHQQHSEENASSSQQLSQLLPYGHHDMNNRGPTVYHHHQPQASLYELSMQPTNKYRIMQQQQLLFEDTHHTLLNESQANNNYGINTSHTTTTTTPTLLSHQHLPVPFHSALPPPPPSSTVFSHMSFNNSSSPETTSALSYSNYATSSSSLPPSSLNWNDWSVYMDQHASIPSLTSHTETSPENAHLQLHR